mgnify:CR=1 FL=1
MSKEKKSFFERLAGSISVDDEEPVFEEDEEIEELFTKLKEVFVLSPQGEYSIEVDPRTVDDKRLKNTAK